MSRNVTVGLESHVSTIKQQLTSPVVAIWEPPLVQQAKAATAPVEIPIEQQLIDTIEAPLHANETSRVGNDRKEREVATLLAQLTPVQSLALSKRLAVNAASDPLVAAFGRMVVDRRNRLIAFLDRLRRGR